MEQKSLHAPDLPVDNIAMAGDTVTIGNTSVIPVWYNPVLAMQSLGKAHTGKRDERRP